MTAISHQRFLTIHITGMYRRTQQQHYHPLVAEAVLIIILTFFWFFQACMAFLLLSSSVQYSVYHCSCCSTSCSDFVGNSLHATSMNPACPCWVTEKNTTNYMYSPTKYMAVPGRIKQYSIAYFNHVTAFKAL